MSLERQIDHAKAVMLEYRVPRLPDIAEWTEKIIPVEDIARRERFAGFL